MRYKKHFEMKFNYTERKRDSLHTIVKKFHPCIIKKTVSLLINEKPGADVVALKSHKNCTAALRERINFIFIIPPETRSLSFSQKEYIRICITTSLTLIT